MAADTIPSRLLAQAQNRPNAAAYHVRSNGRWEPTSWKTYVGQVREAGKALLALGFVPGSKATIIGFNRPEWTIADLATMCVGGAPAGIYTTCSPEEVAYITGHTEAAIAFAEDAAQLADGGGGADIFRSDFVETLPPADAEKDAGEGGLISPRARERFVQMVDEGEAVVEAALLVDEVNPLFGALGFHGTSPPGGWERIVTAAPVPAPCWRPEF